MCVHAGIKLCSRWDNSVSFFMKFSGSPQTRLRSATTKSDSHGGQLKLPKFRHAELRVCVMVRQFNYASMSLTIYLARLGRIQFPLHVPSYIRDFSKKEYDWCPSTRSATGVSRNSGIHFPIAIILMHRCSLFAFSPRKESSSKMLRFIVS